MWGDGGGLITFLGAETASGCAQRKGDQVSSPTARAKPEERGQQAWCATCHKQLSRVSFSSLSYDVVQVSGLG